MTKLHDRAMAAFLQALAAGVEGGADADRLAEAAAVAAVEAMREAWRMRLDAAATLLEAAEAALDRAEAAPTIPRSGAGSSRYSSCSCRRRLCKLC